MKVNKRAVVLIVPVLATILIGFLIGGGYLSFGGGEKDIILLIPLCLLSLLFIVSGLLLWRAKIPPKIWFLKSLMYSISILLFLWLSLLIYSVAFA
jgi:hypothetical protein